MMAGALDTLCPPERAWDQALRIPSFANYLLVDGKGHTGIPSTQEPYWSLILDELVEGYPEQITKQRYTTDGQVVDVELIDKVVEPISDDDEDDGADSDDVEESDVED